MQIKNVRGLVAAAGVAMLAGISGCSTPMPPDTCAPGGLCAPTQANTSTREHPPAALADARAHVPTQAKPAPLRIALLLPLRSDTLAGPAEAVRAGFMAAHEREPDGIDVSVKATGARDAVEVYRAAVDANDMVVGPLARADVAAVAASGAVNKTTIALNHPGGEASLPPAMLTMGLSIEDEARQVARWAGSDHPGVGALIVTGTSAWQKRTAGAFAAQCKQEGTIVDTIELPASNGYLSDSALRELKTRIDTDPPGMLLAALDADQLRRVRESIGMDVPVYGTSSVNPGNTPGSAVPALDGVHLIDLPWEVQSSNPSVMIYPRPVTDQPSLDLDRLYALGIDAYRVAREIALGRDLQGSGQRQLFQMDGVTGRLSVRYGDGPAQFERQQPGVIYRGGNFELTEPVR